MQCQYERKESCLPVMHVLFLLLEEMVRDGVESVAPQLVVSHKDEKKIELDPPFNVDDFVLSLPHLLALKNRLLDLRLDALHPTHEVKVGHVQVLGPVEQVGQIEVVDVVSCDDVWISQSDELRPLLQEFALLVERDDVASHDLTAGVERENVADEGLGVTLSSSRVCY